MVSPAFWPIAWVGAAWPARFARQDPRPARCGKGATNPHRTAIAELNQLLSPLGQKPRVTLLDITEKWLGPDGAVATELMPDSLPPNEKGYAVWAEVLRPLLPKE